MASTIERIYDRNSIQHIHYVFWASVLYHRQKRVPPEWDTLSLLLWDEGILFRYDVMNLPGA
jgi:hypothetical protein